MNDRGAKNAADELLAEFERDDVERGELIETEHFSCWNSELAPGDLVIFRLRHRAFPEQLPELAGRVKVVFGGHEMVYLIEVLTTGELPWPDLLVRRGDILRAWPAEV